MPLRPITMFARAGQVAAGGPLTKLPAGPLVVCAAFDPRAFLAATPYGDCSKWAALLPAARASVAAELLPRAYPLTAWDAASIARAVAALDAWCGIVAGAPVIAQTPQFFSAEAATPSPPLVGSDVGAQGPQAPLQGGASAPGDGGLAPTGNPLLGLSGTASFGGSASVAAPALVGPASVVTRGLVGVARAGRTGR